MEFLALMTQGLYAQPEATLNQMSGMLKDINPQLEISGPGLQQRIVGSGREFLKEMLSEALHMSVTSSVDESIPELLKVHLLDSTQISLPENLSSIWAGSGGCASKAGLKLQLMLDYRNGKYEEIIIDDGTSADQSYIKEAVKLIGPGELMIYDLGYFDLLTLLVLTLRVFRLLNDFFLDFHERIYSNMKIILVRYLPSRIKGFDINLLYEKAEDRYTMEGLNAKLRSMLHTKTWRQNHE